MERELEQEFLKLPTLNHVGMALLQFAFNLQGTRSVLKGFDNTFLLSFVSFKFPQKREMILMFLRNLDVNSDEVQEFGFKFLPLKIEDSQALCFITHHGQLAQAAKYIWIAHKGYLEGRQIPSAEAENN